MFLEMALAGIIIGILSGLLGVGGGMMMVPLFRLGLGMSAVVSTATSLFTIIPTSLSGAVTRIREKTCYPKLGVALGVGGACLSPVGVWLAQLSPGWLVMCATAAVIAYSSFTTLKKALKLPRDANMFGLRGKRDVQPGQKSDMQQGTGIAKEPRLAPAAVPCYEAPKLSGAALAKALGIGALAGTASGYVGLGGGFVMIPMMVSVLNMPMKLASGTSLIAIIILAAPATIMQCMIGNVDYLVGVAMACGSIPGAIIGARLVVYMPERTLRFAFAGMLGVAAVLLVVRELSLF